LNNVLKNADYGGAGERITCGNLAGRDSWRGHDLKERLKRLEEKQEKTDVEIIGLKHHVKALTLTAEEYRKIRHRFLEVYR
jgi:hypothetical protein